MSRKQSSVQKFIDHYLSKTFLRFIPNSVRPNHITVLRVLLTPVVYILLTRGQMLLGILLFVITAFTDALDGAMARTRNQITNIGKVIDPLADKLLILSVLAFIGFKYPIIQVISIFIIFEMIAVAMGYVFSPVVGKPVGANVFGKLKLIVQTIGVTLFLIGLLLNLDSLIDVSIWTLIIAMVLASLAALEVVRQKFLQVKQQY